MPVPGSPPPSLSLPDMFEEQFRVLPVVVSARVPLSAVAVMAPPGLTVQVCAAAATCGPVPRLATRTAPPARTAAAKPARMAIAFLIEARTHPHPGHPRQQRPA